MSGVVLAELMAQGVREGADLTTLRAIAEEAGELGASRALLRLGLSDERARADLAELRGLLGAWRDARRSVWRAALRWVTAAVLAGIAVRLGFEEWLR